MFTYRQLPRGSEIGPRSLPQISNGLAFSSRVRSFGSVSFRSFVR
jgi:hypothetical protein